jgi:phage terminase large subunit GpA-like protein
LPNARLLCRKVAAEALAPDPELLVSDWADRFRRLSTKASAEAGEWKTSRTPYLREIMNAMSPSHPATDGDFKKGTQIGGSEGLYNVIGFSVDQVPCPAMLLMPTVDTAQLISKQRLQPMFDETPALAKKLGEQRSRDSTNTTLRKDYPGGMLLLRGANSGPGLRNVPIRILLGDEIDAYPDDVDGEGDPWTLAQKRTDQFGVRAKRFACSSPKIKGKSRIDRLYQRGTQASYYVPCPHCRHEQVLKWGQIRWEMEKRRELVCTGCGAVTDLHGATLEACPHCAAPAQPDAIRASATDDVAEAWYECEACNARIDEHYKTAMLEQGRHIHAAPGIGEVLADDDPHPHAIWARINDRVRRFLPRFRRALTWHVSALYSPLGWFSWRRAVMQYLEAEKGGYNEETGESFKQVFSNTVLGEAYEVPGEQPKWKILKLRAEPYDRGTVPAGGLVLIAFVDVQGDRFEVAVQAFGRGEESWLIDYQVIAYKRGAKQPGPEDWAELVNLRDKAWPHAGGQTLRITAMGIDSGYLTQEVYDHCRKWGHRHVIATKGMQQRGKAILGRPTLQDVNYNGKVIKGGVQLWPIGVDTAKERIYTRLAIEQPGPGYMHFPRGLEDAYYDGLASEKRIPRRVKGSDINEWVKTRERNEPLDIAVGCLATAIYAGVPRANWDLIEQVINPGQRDLLVEAARAPAPPDSGVEPAAPHPADKTEEPEPSAAPPERATAQAGDGRGWLSRREGWLRR